MLGRLSWREGSGFDKIFEVLLSPGPQAPELIETHDRVQVTLCRRILKPKVIDCIARANQTCQLIQRERIGLEIPRSRIRRSIEQLVKAGKLVAKGVKSGTRYSLPSFGSKPGLSAKPEPKRCAKPRQASYNQLSFIIFHLIHIPCLSHSTQYVPIPDQGCQ